MFVVNEVSVIWCLSFVFFFFKQKTAYDMRISDWSSDVCSSDLDATATNNSKPLDTHFARLTVAKTCRRAYMRRSHGRYRSHADPRAGGSPPRRARYHAARGWAHRPDRPAQSCHPRPVRRGRA